MSEQNFQTQPDTPVAESGQPGAATMSTPETLMSIFFEPGRTFEALRASAFSRRGFDYRRAYDACDFRAFQKS